MLDVSDDKMERHRPLTLLILDSELDAIKIARKSGTPDTAPIPQSNVLINALVSVSLNPTSNAVGVARLAITVETKLLTIVGRSADNVDTAMLLDVLA